MLDRNKLSSHLYQDDEILLANYIFDKIEMVFKGKNIQSTNFLNPHQCEIGVGILEQVYEVSFLVDGGYKGAERKRIAIFPEYFFPDLVELPVNFLKILGNFKFQSVDHRDFLGSLMGLGIKREMIGDILVGDDFAQVAVASEIQDFIMMKLDHVHEVPVEVVKIEKEELVIPEDNGKEIRSTVASMRLDAVASAGFGDSRNKISRDIKNDKLKLNWQVENNPSATVEIGDLISIRGRGRVKVVKDNGFSHRGRVKLLLKRYT